MKYNNLKLKKKQSYLKSYSPTIKAILSIVLNILKRLFSTIISIVITTGLGIGIVVLIFGYTNVIGASLRHKIFFILLSYFTALGTIIFIDFIYTKILPYISDALKLMRARTRLSYIPLTVSECECLGIKELRDMLMFLHNFLHISGFQTDWGKRHEHYLQISEEQNKKIAKMFVKDGAVFELRATPVREVLKFSDLLLDPYTCDVIRVFNEKEIKEPIVIISYADYSSVEKDHYYSILNYKLIRD